MIIKKYTKGKNGMYIISLDNDTKVKIHEDLILKYNLLLTKELDTNLIEIITNENKIYEIYDIAVKYLNIRLRSHKELIDYLKKKDFEVNVINDAIDILTKQGYLDDSIYTTSFIHDKILMSNYGPNKIKGELEKLEIPANIINEKLIIFNEELEKERIEKIIAKQIKNNHNKSGIILKKKIQSNLLMLGYSPSYINECLNNKTFYNKDIYEKESKKIYQKLSKKYSGKELEYKLKQKLYQLGFSNNDFG